MKIKSNSKPLLGRAGQILVLLAITFLVLALPVTSRAQSGGPGNDHGVVLSIDDAKLDIRDGSHTRTYTTNEHTRWLNKNLQPIDAGDVVQKKVSIKWRFVTGGMEAMEVKLQ